MWCDESPHTYPGDFAVGFFVALCLKRGIPDQKLVTEHTQTPQVHLFVVSFALDHLWREVVKRATQCRPPVHKKRKRDRTTH